MLNILKTFFQKIVSCIFLSSLIGYEHVKILYNIDNHHFMNFIHNC